MKRLLAFAVMTLSAGCGLRAETDAKPGPAAVAQMDMDWQDAKRDRKVPARLYYPKDGDGPFPLIVFSHGWGGNKDMYAYLGRHWAGYGYVVVHVQHLGSDTGVLAGGGAGFLRSMLDPRNSVERPKDISFAIDKMTALNGADGPLKGRLDLQHIGVAGHSGGGFTTLAIAGEVFPVGKEAPGFGDPRVSAGIAISAPKPLTTNDYDQAFAAVKIPVLHVTGTNDNLPLRRNLWIARREAYDHIKAAGQALLIFNGANHMTFAGLPRAGDQGTVDKRVQQLLQESSTSWWDTWLKGDAKARQWLLAGGFAGELGGDGTFEAK
jgi:predicted dienelactone hydrolase